MKILHRSSAVSLLRNSHGKGRTEGRVHRAGVSRQKKRLRWLWDTEPKNSKCPSQFKSRKRKMMKTVQRSLWACTTVITRSQAREDHRLRSGRYRHRSITRVSGRRRNALRSRDPLKARLIWLSEKQPQPLTPTTPVKTHTLRGSTARIFPPLKVSTSWSRNQRRIRRPRRRRQHRRRSSLLSVSSVKWIAPRRRFKTCFRVLIPSTRNLRWVRHDLSATCR